MLYIFSAHAPTHHYVEQRQQSRSWGQPLAPFPATKQPATAPTWKMAGYPSERIAQLTQTIADPNTTPELRRTCFAAMSKKNPAKRPAEPTEDKQQKQKLETESSDDRKPPPTITASGAYCFTVTPDILPIQRSTVRGLEGVILQRTYRDKCYGILQVHCVPDSVQGRPATFEYMMEHARVWMVQLHHRTLGNEEEEEIVYGQDVFPIRNAFERAAYPTARWLYHFGSSLGDGSLRDMAHRYLVQRRKAIHPELTDAEVADTFLEPETELDELPSLDTGDEYAYYPPPTADASNAPFSFPVIPEQLTTHAMQTALTPRHVHLGISQVLPHIHFPIRMKSEATIMSMVDSGSGLNLGSLSYHRSIADKCPQVVEEFTNLTEAENLNEFDIGGVDTRANSTKITAVVTYKTPYRVNGRPVHVSFGLSEHASINTILGLTFIRATRCAVLFSNDGNESLVCQELGATFRLDYHPPHRANAAPSAGCGAQQSFTATPPSVMDNLEASRKSLAQSLDQVTQGMAAVSVEHPEQVRQGYSLSPDAVDTLAPDEHGEDVEHDWVMADVQQE